MDPLHFLLTKREREREREREKDQLTDKELRQKKNSFYHCKIFFQINGFLCKIFFQKKESLQEISWLPTCFFNVLQDDK